MIKFVKLSPFKIETLIQSNMNIKLAYNYNYTQ